MTHAQAIEEMKVLAGDRKWSLRHETSSWGMPVEINGYIERLGFGGGSPHYAGAIENIKVMLGLVGCDPAPEDTEGERK